MIWRIDEHVVRGELDSRTKGRIIGRIWLLGRSEPLLLDLEGTPHRDLAGHRLSFTNPRPIPADLTGLSTTQTGVCGTITAARKTKVPQCSTEELMLLYANFRPMPWHWRNTLCLEWHDRRNGRVLIESSDYHLTVDPVAAWSISPAEEAGLAAANRIAINRHLAEFGRENLPDHPTAVPQANGDDDPEDDDAPQSAAEAAADAATARMDLLTDRIGIRLEREGYDQAKFEIIIVEESARLRREYGDFNPPPDPAEEIRLDFLNPVMIDHPAAGSEYGLEAEDEEPHPLLSRCTHLAIRLHEEADEGGWLPAKGPPEHPITELVSGVMNASSKLAGAFGMHQCADESWPPPPGMASSSLVRLKKTRACLRDALRALASADHERLGHAVWRVAVRAELTAIMTELGTLITEVRGILADDRR
jgi:hypothetical protein